MNRPAAILLLAIALFIGLSLAVATLQYASSHNSAFGFPLDDPWIHLQFAKNLHDYGSFSYYKNEMATSGSTSPLYTMLLAAGFSVTNNEMILSYALGILFLLLAGLAYFRLLSELFRENLILIGFGVLFLMVAPLLQWAALSGMETTLFIFLLLAAFFSYVRKKGAWFGIVAGLLLWTRPETLLFLGIIVLDVLYRRFVLRSPQTPRSKKQLQPQPRESLLWLKNPAFIFAAFALAYAGFNLLLSGSIFPNTFAAKIKYYAHGRGDYAEQVWRFLTTPYLIALDIFITVSALASLYHAVKRQAVPMLIPFLWSVGMIVAYGHYLPYLYQQGRYLMPVIPFIILLGLDGIHLTIEQAKKLLPMLRNARKAMVATIVLSAIVAVQFFLGIPDSANQYTDYCRYIGERQVRAAYWIRDHLPENAVVATHDIGAMGFYSHRKIVDMVGLVSPEMIERIGSYDQLTDFLVKKKATHLAVLRDWFEITNQTPLYQTDEQHPEIVEIFQFDPMKTHFTPPNVSKTVDEARMQLGFGNIQLAGPLLEQAIQLDSLSSRVRFFMGVAYMLAGNYDKAKFELNEALRLYPDYWKVYPVLAEVAARQQQPQVAIAHLETVLLRHPEYAEGYRALAQVYQTFHLDSAKARKYNQRYQELSSGVIQ